MVERFWSRFRSLMRRSYDWTTSAVIGYSVFGHRAEWCILGAWQFSHLQYRSPPSQALSPCDFPQTTHKQRALKNSSLSSRWAISRHKWLQWKPWQNMHFDDGFTGTGGIRARSLSVIGGHEAAATPSSDSPSVWSMNEDGWNEWVSLAPAREKHRHTLL